MSGRPKKISKTVIKEIRLKHTICPICSGELDIPVEALHVRCDFCKRFAHDDCHHIIGTQKVMDTEVHLMMCSECLSDGLLD